ncbi:MAG TPA: DUF5668 domain-containing protein [Thermoanaerobaculia bacterium]
MLFIAFGTVLTAGNLGYEVDDVFELWPVVLVVIGLAKLSSSLWGGLFWILAGVLFLVPRFYSRVDVGDLWPLLLILIGLRVATRSFDDRRRRRSSAPVAAPDDKIRLTAVFATRRRRVTSRAFRGGDVVAILGGGEVDLTEALPAGGQAVLEVLALWGGVDVRVPPEWRVSLEITAVMGGAEDARDAAELAAVEPGGRRPHLVVRGFTMMGGVDVRS